MFGRKKKKAAATLKARKVHHPAKTKKPADLSPMEQTKKHANSTGERRKSAPAV